MTGEVATIRLIFVDEGAYHREEITLPAEVLEGYERLIDCLREEPAVLKRLHVDVGRLCGAYRVESEDGGEEDGPEA